MHLSRRCFAVTTLGLLAGAAGPGLALARPRGEPAAPDREPPRFFQWRDITPAQAAPGVRLYAGLPPQGLMGTGGNSLLVVGSDAALLVDTKMAALGRTIRQEAEAVAGRPLTHVVNTHHHADHTGGNQAFATDVSLLAHKNAQQRLLAQFDRYKNGIEGTIAQIARQGGGPAIDQVLEDARRVQDGFEHLKPESFGATKLVERDINLNIGGVEVWLRHFGPGHTDNDLVIHLPGLNVVHTGDLIFNNLHPFMDGNAGCTSVGWQQSLDAIIRLCDGATTVIPGHGELTTIEGVRAQYRYFDKLREIVRHAKDVESMTRDEVVKLRTGAFEGYGFDHMLSNSLGIVFDELAGG